MMRILTAIVFIFMGLAAHAGEVQLAVAANFATPIEEINKLFTAKTGHTVKVSLGATGQLYSQIKNGAPFQVFFAADKERPEKLVKEGDAIAKSLFVYSVGKLILWSEKYPQLDADTLKTGKFKHLAIASPKAAPYGEAAKQTLTKLGLWDGLQDKIVQGDSITQAYQFVATGSAELGFIALSQYQSKPKGKYWMVPQEMYQPLEQAAVLLKSAEKDEVALAFMTFMKTKEVRQLIEKFGYSVP
jgi:molybdate transport system substrate-binding protein